MGPAHRATAITEIHRPCQPTAGIRIERLFDRARQAAGRPDAVLIQAMKVRTMAQRGGGDMSLMFRVGMNPFAYARQPQATRMFVRICV